MLSFEIERGATVMTAQDAKGRSITGTVLSKGTKNAKVQDAAGGLWNVPFHMIVAVDESAPKVAPVAVVAPYATTGDYIIMKNGTEYKVDKVNQSRYSATETSTGKSYYVPFAGVVKVVSAAEYAKQKNEKVTAWLLAKGLTAADAVEFLNTFK